MAAIYTRADLRSALNRRLHNKLGILSDPNATINDAVREVTSRVDLRSMKRKAVLAPNLFNEIWQYSWPSDAKARKIIGLQRQDMEREVGHDWTLVDEEEFDRYKEHRYGMVSFSNRDMVTKLLISTNDEYEGFNVSPLDALTGSATWSAYGDATNLSIDNDYYIRNRSSIKFDLSAAGGTTAGIVSSDLPTFDLTRSVGYGSAFVWAWITSTTGLTNFKLRIGTDSSNYYEMTATTTNESAVFQTGWNLIRFDFSGKTTVGTPTLITNNYAAIFMTKLGSKISEVDYRFDNLMIKHGRIHNLLYYSRYPWQSSAGVWKPNSTDNSDFINVEDDEYNMIIEKCVEWGADEAREPQDSQKAGIKFESLLRQYRKDYKSEALRSEGTYYNI